GRACLTMAARGGVGVRTARGAGGRATCLGTTLGAARAGAGALAAAFLLSGAAALRNGRASSTRVEPNTLNRSGIGRTPWHPSLCEAAPRIANGTPAQL